MSYPPPQGPGQQPYAPQPPGYGYQQPPQQQQWGAPPPQQQWGGPPQQQQQWGAPPPPPPARSGMGVKQILRIVGIVVAVIAVGVFWILSLNDSDNAEAGDCLTNKGTMSAPDLEVVECGDSSAEYEVVKRIDDTLDGSKCEGVAGATRPYSEQTSGSRRSSGEQFVLCLKDL
ncbi:LppU/SCO3897 family protein [Streptomyces sp. NPDC002851]